MRESIFQRYVTEVAQRLGWKTWHVPAPMRATPSGWVGAKEGAGLPDLILLHSDPPRLIFAELKAKGGKLSDAQREFLLLAREVVECYVWAPGDEDLLEDVLKAAPRREDLTSDKGERL